MCAVCVCVCAWWLGCVVVVVVVVEGGGPLRGVAHSLNVIDKLVVVLRKQHDARRALPVCASRWLILHMSRMAFTTMPMVVWLLP